jgi:RNA polymerase subunit RPABC4/transcription elongation factor Spt4
MRDTSEGVGICLIMLLVICAVVAFKGGIGYLIGRSKGRPGLGFLLGLLLGIIGWIIIACLPAEEPPMTLRRPVRPSFPCPSCHRPVAGGLGQCPHCNVRIGGGKMGPGAIPPVFAEAQDRVACPYCAEMILPDARVCRWCHSSLT